MTKRHRLGLLENNVIGLVPVQMRTGSYAAAAGNVISEYLGISADNERLPTAAETITQQHATWLAYCQKHSLDPTTSEPITTTKAKPKAKAKPRSDHKRANHHNQAQGQGQGQAVAERAA